MNNWTVIGLEEKLACVLKWEDLTDTQERHRTLLCTSLQGPMLCSHMVNILNLEIPLTLDMLIKIQKLIRDKRKKMKPYIICDSFWKNEMRSSRLSWRLPNFTSWRNIDMFKPYSQWWTDMKQQRGKGKYNKNWPL